MKFYIGITDFHNALIDAMSTHDDVVVKFPKRGSRGDKLRALPALAYALLRALLDRNAHVYVAHPFSSVNSAFMAVAKRVSFFDDGVAYYARPLLPSGRREQRDRWLTRRKIDWASIERLERPTYPDMLVHANLHSFHAVFPELLPDIGTPVEKVDIARAFTSSVSQSSGGVVLFLDTRDDALPDIEVGAVLEVLRAEGARAADRVLRFKPHPSQVSRISAALRNEDWAVELMGPLEPMLTKMPVARVLSFSSSGALSVKFAQPHAAIVNMRVPGHPVVGHELFSKLGAEELTIE